MIAIDMEMPEKCKECRLLDAEDNCTLLRSEEDWTWEEQYAHCPLIDMDKYQDDGK
jgi:hypothetical protein